MTVYSKERGLTHPPRPENRSSYPPHRAPRVSVPPNYRGHAIVDGEERPLGSLNGDRSPSHAEDHAIPDAPIPRFDGLPRVSQLGESRRQPPTYLAIPAYAEVTPSPEDADLPEVDTTSREAPQNTAAPHGTPSPTVSLPRHPLAALSVGLEELLLLGLILFLLMENSDCLDRGDLDETVILLGLLLLLR